MKLSKKKVFALALAVCLIAILSLGTLAWFTDSETVKNDFYFADSETSDPDDIFSVDVWEDLDGDGDEDTSDGHEYEDVLPGDELDKYVHVENTGNYDQYIRVTVTISDALVWQSIYETTGVVPLTTMVNGLKVEDLYAMRSYVDTDSDSFVYVLYYEDILEIGKDLVVFETVKIPTQMEVKDAANMGALFNISVKAEAVQTEHVGDNVVDAFDTIFSDVIVDTVWVDTVDELKDAIIYTGVENVYLTAALTIDSTVVLDTESPVTIVANGVEDVFTVVSGGTLKMYDKISVISNEAILYANGGLVHIAGANFTCTGEATLGYAANGGTIRVNKGTLTAAGNVLSANGGKIEINGGTISTNSSCAAIHVRNSSTLTMTGATTIGDVGVRSGSVATISKNTTIQGKVAVYDGGDASATITGGTIGGQVYTYGDNVTLTISGGRFGYKPDDQYLANGYSCEWNSNGPSGGWYIVSLADNG